MTIKKHVALLAIAGMLTTPAAMAQDPNGAPAATPSDPSLLAGLERATNLSATQLAVGSGFLAAGMLVSTLTGGGSNGTGTGTTSGTGTTTGTGTTN